MFSLENNNECMTALRFITSQRPKPMSWRDNHPYMLAEQVEYEPVSGETGTLKVTGYARGNPFNANRLVHIQNFGDFQIQQITSSPLSNANEMQEDGHLLDTPKPDEQDDLVAENEPDFMDNEQTWPTEEEMAEADERVRRMRGLNENGEKKRVPKGTSSYQAAWIVDDEDVEYSEEEEEEDANMMEEYQGDDDIVEAADVNFPDDDEYEEIEMEGKNENEDVFDAEEEARQYEEYLKQRQEEFQAHKEFPDEIDTPMHVSARERFARYRGLQSFRTSPWDPYENLPVDYSRIFRFENYNRTKARVVSQAIVGNVKAGARITIWISNVPIQAFGKY